MSKEENLDNNKKHTEIEETIRQIEKQLLRPDLYGLDILKEAQMRKTLEKLKGQLKTLPPEQVCLGTLNLVSDFKLVSDRVIFKQNKTGRWYATFPSLPNFYNIRTEYDSEGLPLRVFYDCADSSSGGLIKTYYFNLTINEKVEVSRGKPIDVKQPLTKNCKVCNQMTVQEMLVCPHCGTPFETEAQETEKKNNPRKFNVLLRNWNRIKKK